MVIYNKDGERVRGLGRRQGVLATVGAEGAVEDEEGEEDGECDVERSRSLRRDGKREVGIKLRSSAARILGHCRAGYY